MAVYAAINKFLNVETERGGKSWRIVQRDICSKEAKSVKLEGGLDDYASAHRMIKRHNRNLIRSNHHG